MKILIVVGARPNFMKAAPLIKAIQENNDRTNLATVTHTAVRSETLRCCLVHTGQHYDETMSGSFFADLDLPSPDIHLAVGSASHAVQTAEIMRRFEEVLLREQPDAVVVVGDVNSTVACALVAAKIKIGPDEKRPLVAHVEAGLRSFDRDMPEEINRIVTDHLSDLLFVTEESGIRNLLREGIAKEKIHFVGNTMIDSLLASKEKASKSTILQELSLLRHSHGNGSGNGISRYAVLTLHRPSNVDHHATFLNILQGLQELSNACPILFSTHPRTGKRIRDFGLEHFFAAGLRSRSQNDLDQECPRSGIHLLSPLGYLDFLCLMKHAALVVTDSGGIQEETTCLGVPCVTVRENTERPVTVTCGTNVIAGTNPARIRIAVQNQISANRQVPSRTPDKWDGRAGKRIIRAIAWETRMRSACVQVGPTLASPVGCAK